MTEKKDVVIEKGIERELTEVEKKDIVDNPAKKLVEKEVTDTTKKHVIKERVYS